MVVQNNYSINPPVGFPGQIAEPNSPKRIERGVLHIESSATRTNPRPGDALFYNNAQNGWQVPITAADMLAVGAILSYPADTVANVASIVQFSDNDEIEIITMGVVWVIAGGASERGDLLAMQVDDWKYDETNRVTGITALHEVPIQNYDNTPAVNNAIIKAAIGYGRVI